MFPPLLYFSEAGQPERIKKFARANGPKDEKVRDSPRPTRLNADCRVCGKWKQERGLGCKRLKRRFSVQFAEEKTRVRFKEVALYPQLPAIYADCGEVYFQGSFETDWSLEEPKKDYVKITVSVPKES
jgi:hypothetical protein